MALFLDKIAEVTKPISLWRHNPDSDRCMEGLIEWTLQEQEKFKWDFVKVTATGTALCEPFGVETELVDNQVGTTQISETPYVELKNLKGLEHEFPLDFHEPQWPILATTEIRRYVDPGTPVMATLFTPETMLAKLTGGRNKKWDVMSADYVNAIAYFQQLLGLQVAQLKTEGVEAVFLASQVSNREHLSEDSTKAGIVRERERAAQRIVKRFGLDCVYHIHGSLPHLDAFNDASQTEAITHWHIDEAPVKIDSVRSYNEHQLSGGIPRDLCAPASSEAQISTYVNNHELAEQDILITPSCTMNQYSSEEFMSFTKEQIKGSN